MTSVKISKDKNLKRKVKELYKSAFPKEEQLPWYVLRLAAMGKHSAINAYADGDEFCGFTYSIDVDNVYFIMFFAVEEKLRGKGIGSKILSKIKEDNKGKTVILNIEPIEEDAPNIEERKNRLAFYKKNGFYDTGYLVREVGGVFTVMATDEKIDVEAYKKVFRAFSLGFWDVEIKSKEEWN